MIDYEWLGVGRIRFGLAIGAGIIYVHEINYANSQSGVYMSSPNLPPAQYDHEYKGPLFHWDVHIDVIRTMCKGKNTIACAHRKNGTCVVLMADRLRATPEKRAAIWRHEMAHCNGWRH